MILNKKNMTLNDFLCISCTNSYRVIEFLFKKNIPLCDSKSYYMVENLSKAYKVVTRSREIITPEFKKIHVPTNGYFFLTYKGRHVCIPAKQCGFD